MAGETPLITAARLADVTALTKLIADGADVAVMIKMMNLVSISETEPEPEPEPELDPESFANMMLGPTTGWAEEQD